MVLNKSSSPPSQSTFRKSILSMLYCSIILFIVVVLTEKVLLSSGLINILSSDILTFDNK